MEKTLKEVYALFIEGRAICTDSRNIISNSIFFALQGENFNGNDFALSALEKGCSFCIVSDPVIAARDERCFYVEDTLLFLQKLAQIHRERLNIPIIAVTGTNGKTTTKELLLKVLEKKYKTQATKGNLNNHIGVPLTLLSLTDECEIAIIEMGASKMGDIRELCEIARPNYSLITNIGEAHLEGFGSFQGVVKAKSELYQFIEKNGGINFLNGDDPLLCKQAQNLKNEIYSTDLPNSVKGSLLTNSKHLFLSFIWTHKEKIYPIHTQLVGKYNLYNALASIAVALHWGINEKDIVDALEEYQPQNNRSQFIEATPLNNSLIVDAYNANPSSMQIAVQNFSELQYKKKKILLLGDMFELGEASYDAHLSLLQNIEKEYDFEQVFLVGKNFSSLKEKEHSSKIQFFYSREDLEQFFAKNPLKDRLILLKASNSMQFYKLIPLC